MSEKSNTQIILRFISGAKINRIDPFALADTTEITFGREAGCSVRFDDPKDDVVSRKHAVLRVRNKDPLSFAIEDLNSSNGTFVNGQQVHGETELLPEDTVEFGKGGPKFSFDVQPRPDNMAARTRVMSAVDATATRAVDAKVTRAASTASTESPTSQIEAPAKAAIGKNTVLTMLSDERKKTSEVWKKAVAAVIAFVVVGGGALYWRLQKDSEAQAAKVAAEASASASQQLHPVLQQLGTSAGDIVNKYGNSTVWITFSWRLFDKETGRPIFHKAFTFGDGQQRTTLPAYLKIGGKIYPWFTTEDEEHHNYEVKHVAAGSGFVVNEQGFILTNKHVAAGWMVQTEPERYLGNYGIQNAFIITPLEKKKPLIEVVSLKSLPGEIRRWIPAEDGGVLFNSRTANVLSGSLRGTDMATPSNNASLFGKNEFLEVRFPGSGLSINATNVRESTLADTALIKIDSPQALTPVELATEDSVKVGERMIVLGYPAISTSTLMEQSSSERGQQRSRVEVIPEPTVTEGIVSKLGVETTQSGNTVVRGTLGDAFQLGINTTGGGNSGGPVFNSSGKVVGLFTYGGCILGDACVSYAVPIKHGRYLLNPQRAQ
jgi:serine protease Do